jgi:hypothetical protein
MSGRDRYRTDERNYDRHSHIEHDYDRDGYHGHDYGRNSYREHDYNRRNYGERREMEEDRESMHWRSTSDHRLQRHTDAALGIQRHRRVEPQKHEGEEVAGPVEPRPWHKIVIVSTFLALWSSVKNRPFRNPDPNMSKTRFNDE